MPVLVTGIHEISGTLGIPNTWMAGTRPGHDATGGGPKRRGPACRTRAPRNGGTGLVRVYPAAPNDFAKSRAGAL